MENRFADIVLPIPETQIFTYAVPESLKDLRMGESVLVPFGKKQYQGFVRTQHNKKKSPSEPR